MQTTVRQLVNQAQERANPGNPTRFLTNRRSERKFGTNRKGRKDPAQMSDRELRGEIGKSQNKIHGLRLYLNELLKQQRERKSNQ